MEKCYNTDVLKNKVAEWDSVPEKHSAQAKRGIVQRSFKQAVFRGEILRE